MFHAPLHCIYTLWRRPTTIPILFSRSFGETRSQTNERPLCLLYFLSCLPLSSRLPIALCSSIDGEKSSGFLAVSVWSNPGHLAGVIQDLSGITNIGHSFLFVLSCYRMVIWEAAHCRLYVIAKMLIATPEVKKLYPCLVVLCCAWSRVVLWICSLDFWQKTITARSWKMLVLYRRSGKEQNKMLSPDASD